METIMPYLLESSPSRQLFNNQLVTPTLASLGGPLPIPKDIRRNYNTSTIQTSAECKSRRNPVHMLLNFGQVKSFKKEKRSGKE